VLGVPVSALTIRRNSSGVTESEDESDAPADDLPFGAPALAARATIALAGLAAERLILGRYGLGGSSDVASATRTAIMLIDEGASDVTRPLKFDEFDESPRGQDERFLAAAAIVSAARSEAELIVSAHRSAIETVARELLKRAHLSGAELDATLARAGLRPLAIEQPTEADPNPIGTTREAAAVG
jgi:hypothetical protein